VFASQFARDTILKATSGGHLLGKVGAFAPHGKVFYVSSVIGSNNNTGLGDPLKDSLATIDYAVGLTTANKGDIIVVAPDHVETITAAAGIDADVAGISIIGLGNGTNRPTITIGTATTATARINAANVKIANLRFTAGTAQTLVKMLNVNADDATIEDCEFIGTSTATFVVSSAINIATTKDGTAIRRCLFRQGTDPALVNAAADTGCIYLVDSENVLIEDCEFRGFWESAAIHNKTTGAANLWVRRCRGIISLADAQPFLLVSTATGGADRCSFITPAEAATTEATLSGTFGAGFFNFQSFFGNDGGGGQLAIASQAAAT
jgi:hypothetical protein